MSSARNEFRGDEGSRTLHVVLIFNELRRKNAESHGFHTPYF